MVSTLDMKLNLDQEELYVGLTSKNILSNLEKRMYHFSE
jgi:hypothetical protein